MSEAPGSVHHDLEEHGHDGTEPRSEAGYYARRIRAIEMLLVEKGVLTREDVRRQIEYTEARSPANGARLVARAWVDPNFKHLLLADTEAAADELGIDASGPVEFVVVENTPEAHNLVVCTLCSCYPRAILGRPPDWYKSFNYRARREGAPRGHARVRPRSRRRRKDSRARQFGGYPLHGPADVPARNGRHGRRRPRPARNAGLPDRDSRSPL